MEIIAMAYCPRKHSEGVKAVHSHSSWRNTMNRGTRILGAISFVFTTAAIVLGRLGVKAGGGIVPIADPTDVMFAGEDQPGALWVGIGMILLLAGVAAAMAAIRCWLQNRNELKGFSGQVSGIIPK